MTVRYINHFHFWVLHLIILQINFFLYTGNNGAHKSFKDIHLFEDIHGYQEYQKFDVVTQIPVSSVQEAEFINFIEGDPLLAYIERSGNNGAYQLSQNFQLVKFLRNKEDNSYETMDCKIKTNGPLALQSFVMKNATYLFVAQDFDIVNETQGSALYRITPDCDITHVHSVRSHSPNAIKFFLLGSLPCIVVANSELKNDLEIESYVYEWRGSGSTGHFDIFSSFITLNARDVEHFKIYNNHYLAIANHQNNQQSVNIDSEIFIYDLEEHTFKHFQYIPTSGAVDWEFFSFGHDIKQDFFLAVANQYSMDGDQSKNYNVKSVIYKFHKNSFTVFQELDTRGAKRFLSYQDSNGEFVLILTTIFGDVHIYQYNGWNFYEAAKNPELGSNTVGYTEKSDNKLIIKRSQALHEKLSFIVLPMKKAVYNRAGAELKPAFININPVSKLQAYMRQKLESLKARLENADKRYAQLNDRFNDIVDANLKTGNIINITRTSFDEYLENNGIDNTQDLDESARMKANQNFIQENTIDLGQGVNLRVTPEFRVHNLTTNNIRYSPDIEHGLRDNEEVLVDEKITDHISDLTSKLGDLNRQMSLHANKLRSSVKKSGTHTISGTWTIPKLICQNVGKTTDTEDDEIGKMPPPITTNKLKIGVIDRTLDLNALAGKCLNLTADQVVKSNLVFNGGVEFRKNVWVHGLVDGLDTKNLISGTASPLNKNRIIYGGKDGKPIIFESHITLQNDITIKGNLNVDGTLNDVKFDSDNVLFSSKEQVIKGDFNLQNVRVNDLVFNGLLNDKNLTVLWNDTIPINDPNKRYTVQGSKKFNQKVTFQSPITLSNPSIALVNGENFVDLVENALTKTGQQTIEVPIAFTGERVSFDENVELDGKLNGLKFPEDFMRYSETSKQNAIVMNGPVVFQNTVKFRNILTNKKIGSLDISKVIVTSRNETIKNPIIFLNPIQLQNDAQINGLINNDINLTHVLQNGLRTDMPQIIDVDQVTLRGNIHFERGFNISGELNGQNIKTFLDDSIALDDSEILFTNPNLRLSFDTLVVGQLQTPLLGGFNPNKDFVRRESESTQEIRGQYIFDEITLHSDDNSLLGRINGENWDMLFNNDTLLKGVPQIITGKKTFNIPITIELDLTLDGLFDGRNLSDALRADQLANVEQVLFYDSVYLESGLRTGMIEVNGLINGKYLDLELQNAVLLEGDQIIYGDKTFSGDVTVQNLLVDGHFSDRNVKDFTTNVLRRNAKNQIVRGKKTFIGYSVSFEDVDIQDTLNGYRLKDLEHLLTNDNDQLIDIPVLFGKTVESESDIEVKSINQIAWETYTEDFINIQDPKKDYNIKRHLLFDEVEIRGNIYSNHRDIKEILLSDVKMSQDLAIRGRPIVFEQNVRINFESLSFETNLVVKTTINSVSIKDWALSLNLTDSANSFENTKLIGNVIIEGDFTINNNYNGKNFQKHLDSLIYLQDKSGKSKQIIRNPIFFKDDVVFNKDVQIKGLFHGYNASELLSPKHYAWKSNPCPISPNDLTFAKGLVVQDTLQISNLDTGNSKRNRLPYQSSRNKGYVNINVQDDKLNGFPISQLKEDGGVWYDDISQITINQPITFEDDVIIQANVEIAPNAQLNDIQLDQIVNVRKKKHIFKGDNNLVFDQGYEVKNDFHLVPATALIFGINLTHLISDALLKHKPLVFHQDVTLDQLNIIFNGPVILKGLFNEHAFNKHNLLTVHDRQTIRVPIVFENGLCCKQATIIIESDLINDLAISSLATDYLRMDKDQTVDVSWEIDAPVIFANDVTLQGNLNGRSLDTLNTDLQELDEASKDLQILQNTADEQCKELNVTYNSLNNSAIYVKNLILHQEIRKGSKTDPLQISDDTISSILPFSLGQSDYLLISSKHKCPLRNCFPHYLYRKSKSQNYFHPFEVLYTLRNSKPSIISYNDDIFIFVPNAYFGKDILAENDKSPNEETEINHCSPSIFTSQKISSQNSHVNPSDYFHQIFQLRLEQNGNRNIIGLYLYQTLQTNVAVKIKTFGPRDETLVSNTLNFACFVLMPRDGGSISTKKFATQYQNVTLNGFVESMVYCLTDIERGYVHVSSVQTKLLKQIDIQLINNDLYLATMYEGETDTDVFYQAPNVFRWENFIPINPEISTSLYQEETPSHAHFQPFQHLRLVGGSKAKFFNVREHTFLAIIQRNDGAGTGNHLPVLVYKYRVGKKPYFDLIQSIATVGAKNIGFINAYPDIDYLLIYCEGINQQTLNIYQFMGAAYFVEQYELVFKKPTSNFEVFKGFLPFQVYIVTRTQTEDMVKIDSSLVLSEIIRFNFAGQKLHAMLKLAELTGIELTCRVNRSDLSQLLLTESNKDYNNEGSDENVYGSMVDDQQNSIKENSEIVGSHNENAYQDDQIMPEYVEDTEIAE